MVGLLVSSSASQGVIGVGTTEDPSWRLADFYRVRMSDGLVERPCDTMRMVGTHGRGGSADEVKQQVRSQVRGASPFAAFDLCELEGKLEQHCDIVKEKLRGLGVWQEPRPFLIGAVQILRLSWPKIEIPDCWREYTVRILSACLASKH
jgi:hypothetical protein